MKQRIAITLALILMMSVLAGCRNETGKTDTYTNPTTPTSSTNAATTPTTNNATQPTSGMETTPNNGTDTQPNGGTDTTPTDSGNANGGTNEPNPTDNAGGNADATDSAQPNDQSRSTRGMNQNGF